MLALGKESEAHTFDETAGNIMVLCAGATSDSFRRELRLKGRALTLENIQELADDSRRAEKEEQDMNALRGEQVRVVGKAGARQRNQQNSRNRGQTSGKRPCNRCGKDNHTTSELSLIHISEPTRQAEISYAVFCLKKKQVRCDLISRTCCT